jgi:hypothetical protein
LNSIILHRAPVSIKKSKATLDSLLSTVERGFAAIADDITDIKSKTTKDDINSLDTKLTKFEEREIDKRLLLRSPRLRNRKALRYRQEIRRLTDTIDYVATDQNGLTSTSTRTDIIQPAPSIAPADAASTTEAASTAQ